MLSVSPVVSFPPSFARTFSSKERRLGTRQTQANVLEGKRFVCCLVRVQLVKTHYIFSHKCKIISRQGNLIITHSLKPALKHERCLKVFKMSYLQRLPLLAAFRNEFQPVGFLMDFNLSGFAFNAAGLLLRLDATLPIETSLTWIAITDPPFCWVPRTTPTKQRCFKYHDIRYPPRAGLALTILSGIDCFRERHWPL